MRRVAAGWIGALLFSLTGQASAEWKSVAVGSAATSALNVYFIDPSTITRQGDIRRVWMLVEHKRNEPVKERSSKWYIEVNCRERSTRDLQFAAYSEPKGNGERLLGANEPSKWRFVAPDEAMNDVLKAVCK